MTLAALSKDYGLMHCPFCYGERMRLIEWQRMHLVRCLNLQCGAQGPKRHDPDEALEAWNNRTDLPVESPA